MNNGNQPHEVDIWIIVNDSLGKERLRANVIGAQMVVLGSTYNKEAKFSARGLGVGSYSVSVQVIKDGQVIAIGSGGKLEVTKPAINHFGSVNLLGTGGIKRAKVFDVEAKVIPAFTGSYGVYVQVIQEGKTTMNFPIGNAVALSGNEWHTFKVSPYLPDWFSTDKRAGLRILLTDSAGQELYKGDAKYVTVLEG
jgi:hypothetical protein